MVTAQEITDAVNHAMSTRQYKASAYYRGLMGWKSPSADTIRRSVGIALGCLDGGGTKRMAIRQARSGVSVEVIWIVMLIVRAAINWWLEHRKQI